MNIWTSRLSLFAVFLMVPLSSAQKNHRSMSGSAAKGAVASGLTVVPNLSERLSKWRRVRMPFDSKALTPREVKMVNKLVDASIYLEDIFWRQSDPEGLALYQSLAASTSS